jgi:hypothetical protein
VAVVGCPNTGKSALLAAQHILPLAERGRRGPSARAWFKPVLMAVNKTDNEAADGDFQALCELFAGECLLLPVSARTGHGLGRLRRAIFGALEIIRFYSRPPGKEPDLAAPFPLRRGSTIEDLAGKIHRDLQQHLKSARVWGKEVFDDQPVGCDYVLQDGDVVELRT